MGKKCRAIVVPRGEARVLRRCDKDAVPGDADTLCERHRHDPEVRVRLGQYEAILRPGWEFLLDRFEGRAARAAEITGGLMPPAAPPAPPRPAR